MSHSPSENTRPAENSSLTNKVVFSDFTVQSQIAFHHSYDGHGERYIVEVDASGLGSIDYDCDGLIDVCFLNGAPIPLNMNETTSNALYRNLGDMRFVDVTTASHAGDFEFSVGVAVADYDNDGFPDIYVSNFGPNALYRNNGDGTFSDATAVAGVARGAKAGAGVCFLDADQDGALDLYVANYVKSPVERNVKRTNEGIPSYPGPLDFEAEEDVFFHNSGDGTFSDQSAQAGLSKIASTSMGTVAADYDDDGDTDVFVANDVDRNVLLENDGTGRFKDVGVERGIAFSHDGRRNGNMGVDCADYNGDGALDFFVTTFSNEMPALYKNDGAGYFSDVIIESGVGAGLLPHANWGTAFLDVENDGDKDLIIANGHTDPNVSLWAYTTSWKVANSLYLNVGDGHFEDISRVAGSGLDPIESSRGLIVDDFDNDGDVDVIILNALTSPTVLRNETKTDCSWLQVELKGRTSCRDATGTKVAVQAGGKRFVDEVHSGRGYQSSFGHRLYFGLGNSKIVSKLTIRWPGGATQELENIAANQILSVVQN